MDAFIEVSKVYVWPLSIIIVLLVYRNRIHALLDRIISAKLPGGTEISFGNAGIDKNESERDSNLRNTGGTNESIVNQMDIQLNKIGNIYWAGNDLMWTIDVLLRGGNRNTIMHGLRQSFHHLREIGITKGYLFEKMQELYDRAEKSFESDWTNQMRQHYASDLRAIKDKAGFIIQRKQTNFSPEP